MSHVVSVPFAAAFASEEARRGWEIALPRLWERYFETVGKVAGIRMRCSSEFASCNIGKESDGCLDGDGLQGDCRSRRDGLQATLGVEGGFGRNVSSLEGVGLLGGRVEGSSVAGRSQVVDDKGQGQSLEGVVGEELGGERRQLVDDSESNAVRGKHYRRNLNRRLRNRGRSAAVPEWRRGARPVDANFSPSRHVGNRAPGHCETVVSGSTECPSYDRALSDAEREARDTLAQRRAAENKVAKKLAEMKLASLEDEKKCQEYADLKHQRVIQWTNEATAKSQQSLDKVKSIDPSSSASQYEIRQQAKELADTKATLKTMTAILKDLSPDFEADMEACRPCGTAEYAMYAAAGGYSQFSDEIENASVR